MHVTLKLFLWPLTEYAHDECKLRMTSLATKRLQVECLVLVSNTLLLSNTNHSLIPFSDSDQNPSRAQNDTGIHIYIYIYIYSKLYMLRIEYI